MTIPAIDGANYPTQDESRSTLLRAIEHSFARRGLDANTLPSSEHYIRADKYAGRIAVAIANNQLALEDSNPLTSTGDPLAILAGIFGVAKRPAGPAAGATLITSSGTVTIPKDYTATAPSGKKYKTISQGTYASGASVDVIAIDGGTDTNQDAGTQLTWDSAQIGALSPKSIVTSAGLTGGVNADNDERLRERLLQKLAFPPVGGNWSEVVAWAEEATASVEAAYCYPAVRGPSSYDIALTKAGGDRTLPAATIATVRGYVAGKMPGQESHNFTSVTAERVDVVIVARLPLPQVAGGAGGGWRDAAPWPAEDALVTAYNAGTGVATVDAATAPTVGANIGVWNPSATNDDGTLGAMVEYVVATVGGSTGAWTITAQSGFLSTPLGAYVSAGALQLVEYADTFMHALALLGPGEKTESPEILPRGRRQPSTDIIAPSDITSIQLAVLTNAYREIGGATYSAVYDTGTATARVSPSIPATTADPPNVLVLNHLAIRA
jgi:uncharacterized phage protein gp47/JayE